MNKILPYEKMEYKDNQIALDEVSATYIQDGDCTEEKDNVQSITLTTRNNGVARFISIKTDNWSVENLDDLKVLFDDFYNIAKLWDTKNSETK